MQDDPRAQLRFACTRRNGSGSRTGSVVSGSPSRRRAQSGSSEGSRRSKRSTMCHPHAIAHTQGADVFVPTFRATMQDARRRRADRNPVLNVTSARAASAEQTSPPAAALRRNVFSASAIVVPRPRARRSRRGARRPRRARRPRSGCGRSARTGRPRAVAQAAGAEGLSHRRRPRCDRGDRAARASAGSLVSACSLRVPLAKTAYKSGERGGPRLDVLATCGRAW
jgi:hypothetical protein